MHRSYSVLTADSRSRSVWIYILKYLCVLDICIYTYTYNVLYIFDIYPYVCKYILVEMHRSPSGLSADSRNHSVWKNGASNE